MTRIARWLIPTMAALMLLFGTFGVAAAEERGPTQPPKPTGNVELEQLLRLRIAQARSLEEMLKREARRGDEIAAKITRAKAEGKDTTAIEQALAAYREKLYAAHAYWQTAADTLKAHAGFSDGGKVTNADQARATLKAAGSALEQAYRTARGAEEQLNKAIATALGKKK
jgi:hypothetical protein